MKPEALENFGLVNFVLRHAYALEIVIIQGIDIQVVLRIMGVKGATIDVAVFIRPELSFYIVVVRGNVGGHILVK
jgi:hypothetical protein